MSERTPPAAPFTRLARISLLALALGGTACSGDDQAARSGHPAEDGLPAPTAEGDVTGTATIAKAGKGQAPDLGGGAEPLSPEDANLVVGEIPVDPINPETGTGIDPDGDGPLTAPPAIDTGAAEPGPADAVAVVRDYYGAINARDYAQAYGLWSDGGRASRQTAQQFAAGFTQTTQVAVDVGAPGPQEAGAGQRDIEVPVSITATQADGSTRRYVGAYQLHRTVVDGASQEQTRWRIRSADLREVQP